MADRIIDDAAWVIIRKEIESSFPSKSYDGLIKVVKWNLDQGDVDQYYRKRYLNNIVDLLRPPGIQTLRCFNEKESNTEVISEFLTIETESYDLIFEGIEPFEETKTWSIYTTACPNQECEKYGVNRTEICYWPLPGLDHEPLMLQHCRSCKKTWDVDWDDGEPVNE